MLAGGHLSGGPLALYRAQTQGARVGLGIALPPGDTSPIHYRVSMVPEGSMAGKRLVFLALALLAGCGHDHGGAGATDNPNRDLQRPEVDVSAPLNDRAAQGTPTKSTAKTATKATAKTTSKPSGSMLASAMVLAIISSSSVIGIHRGCNRPLVGAGGKPVQGAGRSVRCDTERQKPALKRPLVPLPPRCYAPAR